MIRSKTWTGNSERGVALLIAIFALLLISGVAISLIVMSGTESSLSANYKRTTSAFYAAQAGVEEGRARLTPCFPLQGVGLWRPPVTAVDNCTSPQGPQGSTDALFSMNPPNVLGACPGATCAVLYILNGGTKPANITDPNNALYDWQYALEFPNPPGGPAQNAARVVNSSALMANGQPAMNYKWVRINLKSELMGGIGLTVPPNNPLDATTPLLVMSSSAQCISGTANCSPTGNTTSSPVYRVTALAVDPSGSQRMVQAEVALPSTINPNGAISSQASVTINGNFTALGSYPPIVTLTCGKVNTPTCGFLDPKTGKPTGNCAQPYTPPPPGAPGCGTCGGVPRSCKDYCGQGAANNGVASAGTVTINGSQNLVPSPNSSCTSAADCVSTVSPQQAVSPNNSVTAAYNLDQIVSSFAPPSSTLAENFVNANGTPSGVTCVPLANGGKSCKGQGAQLGTLPSPWPVPPNTVTTNAVPAITYADTGTGGLLTLTGASSGSGILVVEGDLALGGGFQWYGLIIARGTVTLLGGGPTGANIVGGVLAGKDVNNPGAQTVSGGSDTISYDSCAYRNLVGQDALRLLAFREIHK